MSAKTPTDGIRTKQHKIGMRIQLSRSLCGWRTVLVGLLVVPVFILEAQLFRPPRQHRSNLFLMMQFPPYNFFQQHRNNAKNLETLNSRVTLSSSDDSYYNMMVDVRKPVDAMHKMHGIEEQLQQQPEPVNYIDLVVENKNAFFDEDGNKMRPHGQPGNVFSRVFIGANVTPRLKKDSMIIGHHRNVAKPMSLAEQIISNLAANNLAVNFSQSTSTNFWFPFVSQGAKFSNTGRSDDHRNRGIIRIYSDKKPQVIIINGPTRIYGAGTESKFPPFLEFFVQRIQKYFSVYKYEDLSRPGLPSQMPPDPEYSATEDEAVEATTENN
ncbi:hypothetical protein Bhyg_05621 [Pseudolycoriella hygida]|uniref:Uncharacterized protein n=1 Tax=Pseudolycoriella hygida TaxID=35572 RepID=A0A9Q0S225_9DIPT|nr:hypothetical protein Bhyg_05621 [Pseudolycoriella hygida]